jgi:AhpD family alkylhydroperoxidase
MQEPSITKGAEEILVDIRERLGMNQVTPSLFKHLAKNEQTLERVWTCCKHQLLEGNLPRLLKEMVFVTVANERSCTYCTNAHLAFCKMLGTDQNIISHLTQDIESIQPKTVSLALMFARDLISPTPEIRVNEEILLEAGYLPEEIDELIQMIGFASFMAVVAKGCNLSEHPDEFFTDLLNS